MPYRYDGDRIALLACLAAFTLLVTDAAAQGSGFVPGARPIVDLTFAGTPVGEFPTGLRLLTGNLDVVDKNGVHMLRASTPSEFVIQLPECSRRTSPSSSSSSPRRAAIQRT